MSAERETATLSDTPTRRVLVVDDEATIAEAVALRLRSEGFAVEVAHDGPTAVSMAASFAPDLVVLDVMLPGFDGHEVCRLIQGERRIPVIMLTARSEEVDMLVGLGVGADDYMTKPFSSRELVARVHAVLRRTESVVARPASAESSAAAMAVPVSPGGDSEVVYRLGTVMLDARARRVEVDGVERHLTATEFDIAEWLLRYPRTVFTRGQLLQEIWGYTETAGERTVDSHIQAVRRKLGQSFIRTVHGVGYGLGSGLVSGLGSGLVSEPGELAAGLGSGLSSEPDGSGESAVWARRKGE